MNINLSKNIFTNIYLIISIFNLLIKHKPSLVIAYTLKPNLYFSLISKFLKIKYINNFFGLGYLFINRSIITFLIEYLLRFSIDKSQKIFFQNKYDQLHFIKSKIITDTEKTELIPGSGIDINKFNYSQVSKFDQTNFLLISRLLWDKGIGEFINAAKKLKQKYKNVNFTILGSFISENPSSINLNVIKKWKDENIVEFIDDVFDVRTNIIKSHCVVLPSYREGTPKSLLEAMSMGRPIITTDVPGCNHLIKNETNGFLCKVKDSLDLQKKMEKFINLEPRKKILMGLSGRNLVCKKYASEIVIQKYDKVIGN